MSSPSSYPQSPAVRLLYRRFIRLLPDYFSLRRHSSVESAAAELRFFLEDSSHMYEELKKTFPALASSAPSLSYRSSPDRFPLLVKEIVRRSFRSSPNASNPLNSHLSEAFKCYKKILSRYSFLAGPFSELSTHSTAVTNSIRITVNSSFFRDFALLAKGLSGNQQNNIKHEGEFYYFKYSIKIENLSSSECVQLMRRKWIITDSTGVNQTVEGDGVIGKQPILMPGDQYQYESGTPLQTPLGKMEGEYFFRILKDSKSDPTAPEESEFGSSIRTSNSNEERRRFVDLLERSADSDNSLIPSGSEFSARIAPFLLTVDKFHSRLRK
jgi:ApaG protein